MAIPPREIFRVNPVDEEKHVAVGLDLPLVTNNGNPFPQTYLTIDAAKANLKNINVKIEKLDKDIDIHKKRIFDKYPEFKKNFANQIANIKSTQESLKSDEALIQYTVGEYHTFVSIITSDNYGVQRIKPNNQVLTEKINKIRESLQLSNNQPKQFEKHYNYLSCY